MADKALPPVSGSTPLPAWAEEEMAKAAMPDWAVEEMNAVEDEIEFNRLKSVPIDERRALLASGKFVAMTDDRRIVDPDSTDEKWYAVPTKESYESGEYKKLVPGFGMKDIIPAAGGLIKSLVKGTLEGGEGYLRNTPVGKAIVTAANIPSKGVQGAIQEAELDASRRNLTNMASGAEGFTQNLEFLKDIGKTALTYGLVRPTLSEEERKAWDYDTEVEKQIKQQRLAEGKSVLGETLRSAGMDEKSVSGLEGFIDQDIAVATSMFSDPMWLVGGGGKLVSGMKLFEGAARAEKLALLAERSAVMSKAIKAGESVAEATESANRATRIRLESMRVAEKARKAKYYNKPMSELPVVGPVARGAVAAGEAVSNLVQPAIPAVNKYTSIAMQALKNPVATAAQGLGKTVQKTGNVIQKVSDWTLGPGTIPALTRGAITLPGAVASPLVGVPAMIGAMALGKVPSVQAAVRVGKKISSLGELIDIAGSAAKGGGDAVAIGNAARQAGSQSAIQAANLIQGVKGAATPASVRYFKSPFLRVATKGISDVADPVVRGAVVGTGLTAAAGYDPMEGIAPGVVFGTLGHFHGKLGSLINPGMRDPYAAAASATQWLNSFPPDIREGLKRQRPEALDFYGNLDSIVGSVNRLVAPRPDGKPTLEIIYATSSEAMAEAYLQGKGKEKLVADRDAAQAILNDPNATEAQKVEAQNTLNVIDTEIQNATRQSGWILDPAKNDGQLKIVVNANMDADKSLNVGALSHEALGHMVDMIDTTLGDESPMREARQDLITALFGNDPASPEGVVNGRHSPDKMKKLAEDYYAKLNQSPTYEKEVIYGPDGSVITDQDVLSAESRQTVIDELVAEATNVMTQNARRLGKDAVQHALDVINATDADVQKMLDESAKQPGGNQSLLFKDHTNDVATERAAAERFLSFVEATGGDTGSMRVVGNSGMSLADTVPITKRQIYDEAKYAHQAVADAKTHQEAVDARKGVDQVAESGIYKTGRKPRSVAQIEAEKELTLKNGRKPTGKELNDLTNEILEESPLILLNERGTLFQPTDTPIILSKRQQDLAHTEMTKTIKAALAGVLHEDSDAMTMQLTADGKEVFKGLYFTDSQMKAIRQIPNALLPKSIKDNLSMLNDVLRRQSNEAVDFIYQQAIKRNGNIPRTARTASPFSFYISKADNIVVRSWDLTSVERALEKEVAKAVPRNESDRKKMILEPFREVTEGDYGAASLRFRDKLDQFGKNHAEGKSGRDGLDANPEKAKAMSAAIAKFLGFEKDKAKIDLDSGEGKLQNFIKSFRVDRMFGLQESVSTPFGADYKMLKDGKYMPAVDENGRVIPMRPDGGEKFMPEVQMPEVLREDPRFEGLLYNGQQDDGDGPVHYFTDKANGGTFVVIGELTPDAVAAKMQAQTERFARASKKDDMKFMGEVKDPTKDPAFKKWAKGAKLYQLGKSNLADAESGKPIVAELVHGTAMPKLVEDGKFSLDKANVESDLGAALYFSNNPAEVEFNYAGEGPDLTGKIERLAERIYQDLETSSAEDPTMEQATQLAKEQLGVSAAMTVPVYVRMENPLKLGKNEERWDYTFDEETGIESGKAIDFAEAFKRVANRFDDTDGVEDVITATLGSGDFTPSEAITSIRELLPYVTDQNGDIATNELIRQTLEEMGYDGIIDATVNKKFGTEKTYKDGYGRTVQAKSMEGMNPDTVHVIAFSPDQVAGKYGGAKRKATSGDSAIFMGEVNELPIERIKSVRDGLVAKEDSLRKATDVFGQTLRSGVVPMGSWDTGFHFNTVVSRVLSSIMPNELRLKSLESPTLNEIARKGILQEQSKLATVAPLFEDAIADFTASLGKEMEGRTGVDVVNAGNTDPIMPIKQEFPDGQTMRVDEAISRLSDLTNSVFPSSDKGKNAGAHRNILNLADLAQQEGIEIRPKILDKLMERYNGKTWEDQQAAELQFMKELTNPEFNDVKQLEDGTIISKPIDETKFMPQVESPEFKNWFGDSVTVDENGVPVVYYHGTSKDADFATFKIGKRGTFFTTDPKGASEYAMQNDSQRSVWEPGKGFQQKNTASRVIPVFLKVENPYKVTAEDYAKINDSTGKAGNSDRTVGGGYIMPQRLLVEKAKALGHDAIDWGYGTISVFDPTQIKSATGNRGTFDPKSKNISFMPEVESPKFKQWFRKSEAVNEDGTPKFFYHGSKQDVNELKARFPDGLIFLSENPDFAANWTYGTGGIRDRVIGEKYKGREILKKADEKYMSDNREELDRLYKEEKWDEWTEIYNNRPSKKDLPEGWENTAVYPVYVRAEKIFDPIRDYKQIEPVLRKMHKDFPDQGWDKILEKGHHKEGHWIVFENKEVVDYLKSKGYDAMKLRESTIEGSPLETLAVFDSSQVKSAIGNTGEFSNKTNDLRFMPTVEEAPRTRQELFKEDMRGQIEYFRLRAKEEGLESMDDVTEEQLTKWSAEWRESNPRTNEDGEIRFMPEIEDAPRKLNSSLEKMQEMLDERKANLPRYKVKIDPLENDNEWRITITKGAGEGIGYANVHISPDAPDTMSVDETIVLHDYRGKGYGEALYREIAKLAQENDATNLRGSMVSEEANRVRSKLFKENPDAWDKYGFSEEKWRRGGDTRSDIIDPRIKFMGEVASGEVEATLPGKDTASKKSLTKEIINKLERGPKLTRYRAMALIDGKLYPPMSTMIEGSRRPAEAIGEWMQSEERPDLVPSEGRNAGKFRLKGPNGDDVWATYAPYFHSSQNPLNDQFSAAYKKPLVTVEIEIPDGDKYQADGSKRATGEHIWPGGRKVDLSRYAKIKRIVPDREVAQLIAKSLPEGAEVADNVVTPSLLKELEKAGVPIKVSGIVPAKNDIRFMGEVEGDDISRHMLKVTRGERAVGSVGRLTQEEKQRLVESVKGNPKLSTPKAIAALESEIRDIKVNHPASDGWDALEFTGINKQTGKPEFKKIPYGFGRDSKGKPLELGSPEWEKRSSVLANRTLDEVAKLYDRAKAGDEQAIKILKQASWYKEMRIRLRREFGGLGDLFADLLGATSPNTPVRTNFAWGAEILRRAMRGDFDQSIVKWTERQDAIEALETKIKSMVMGLREEVKSAKEAGIKPPTLKALKETPEYKKTLKELKSLRSQIPEGTEPLQESGKKYGIHSNNIIKTLVGLWRKVNNPDVDIDYGGTAPKAQNFSGNLIGFRKGATIDVWAARFLNRILGMLRIPGVSETAVDGLMLETGQTTGGFRMGQDAFNKAAELIRKDPRFSDKSVDPKINEILKNIGDDDLQAVAWFLEKEGWTENNWTSAEGEGGSFELELSLYGSKNLDEIKEVRKTLNSSKSTPEQKAEAEKRLVELSREAERYFAGLSPETATSKATDPMMDTIISGTKAKIYEGNPDGILASKVGATLGRYAGSNERAIDLELVARDGFDPNPLWEHLTKTADENQQRASFLARTLRTDETPDLVKHRPGVEAYFEAPLKTDQVEAMTQKLDEVLGKYGIPAYTLITDASFTRGKKTPGATGAVIGVRFLDLPEMSAREGGPEINWTSMTEDQIRQEMTARRENLNDAALALQSEIPEINLAEVNNYEVRTHFGPERTDSRVSEGKRPSAASGEYGSSSWEGQLVLEAIKAASRSIGEPRSGKDFGQVSLEPSDVPRDVPVDQLPSPVEAPRTPSIAEVISPKGKKKAPGIADVPSPK